MKKKNLQDIQTNTHLTSTLRWKMQGKWHLDFSRTVFAKMVELVLKTYATVSLGIQEKDVKLQIADQNVSMAGSAWM